MNILFVCTGNTCRSPMAEGITRALAAEKHKDVTTVSAGLFAAYGAKPTEQAVVAVRSITDISNHESRPLTMELVNAADLILGMTKDHKSVLLRQFPLRKVKLKRFPSGVVKMVMLRTHMDLIKPYITNVRNRFIT